MNKKSTLFFVFLLFGIFSLNAQKTSSSLKSVDPVNKSATTKPVNKEEILKQISQIDSHLLSIEIKRNHVLADPAEKALAEKQGWFEDMKKIEDSLLKKRKELKALVKN